jgi:hypothetical protein
MQEKQEKNGGKPSSGPGLRRLPNKKSKFISPLLNRPGNQGDTNETSSKSNSGSTEPVDERLKNIDPLMVETIRNEIMDQSNPVKWYPICSWFKSS